MDDKYLKEFFRLEREQERTLSELELLAALERVYLPGEIQGKPLDGDQVLVEWLEKKTEVTSPEMGLIDRYISAMNEAMAAEWDNEIDSMDRSIPSRPVTQGDEIAHLAGEGRELDINMRFAQQMVRLGLRSPPTESEKREYKKILSSLLNPPPKPD